ncbi:ankyrin repeat domain-containing protein [Hymenobacter oligotrophus]|uniref:Ankyrin repeat domain-containing protein n=1 Tax=Hymenobacter oligotrophus TaxID=2319843 RepID=A0A3B7R149_9BACT|nr:ankyrin repeat domain-containing protein [Hymenobacter oligotrophus]AYA37143.1 ankyrin repeat domain-containing protein [Hymenobacter oligotrophus]
MRFLLTLLTATLFWFFTTATAQSLDRKLYEAVLKNQPAKVNKLVDEGADVNYTFKMNSAFYINVLMQATMQNYTDVAVLLIKRGADVNATDGFKMTPLMWAAHHGNLPLPKLLIDNGAKPDADDGLGNTPLKAAKDRKHKEVVSYLESLGAK